MKKTFLTITAVSIISVTGISSLNLTQPVTYAQSKHSFSKEVQGKWTNQSGDEFTIKNSNAKLKIANGKHKGNYKFKVTSQSKAGYKLKAQGKKIAKTTKYALTNSNNGVIEFSYGKQKIKFTTQSVTVSEQSTTTSTTPAPSATTTPATTPAAPDVQPQQTTDPNAQNNQGQSNNTDPYNVYTNPEMYSNRGF